MRPDDDLAHFSPILHHSSPIFSVLAPGSRTARKNGEKTAENGAETAEKEWLGQVDLPYRQPCSHPMPPPLCSVAFNGTKGRIELDCEESPYTVAEHTGMPVDGGDGTVPNIMEAIKGNTKFQAPDPVSLRLRLLWQEPLEIPIPGDGEAGHGGGDRRLLDDIFIGGIDDPLMRAADHVQGARSILTGIA